MTTGSVARCASCRAVVNSRWGACPTCGKALAAVHPDWLTAWRELADRTVGIRKEDPRFAPMTLALDSCDAAFLADDWPAFRRAAEQVRLIARG